MDPQPQNEQAFVNYPRPTIPASSFESLKRTGWIKIGIGFAMALPLMMLVAAIGIARPDWADGLGAVMLVLRLGGVIAMGVGMADVAEAKGHGRGNGWWVLLFLIGLLIVVLLPDRNARG